MLMSQDGTQTSIFDSANSGDCRHLTRTIRTTPDINVRDSYGRTALHYAALNGHSDAARILIHNGADVNPLALNDGASPLHYACLNGHFHTASLLLSQGADVAVQTRRERLTPLHMAVMTHDARLIRLLLNHKADALTTDLHGATSISLAQSHGYNSLARMLTRASMKAGTPSDGPQL
jgi:ankyrin repeat protein